MLPAILIELAPEPAFPCGEHKFRRQRPVVEFGFALVHLITAGIGVDQQVAVTRLPRQHHFAPGEHVAFPTARRADAASDGDCELFLRPQRGVGEECPIKQCAAGLKQ